jgi:hypothetical protein
VSDAIFLHQLLYFLTVFITADMYYFNPRLVQRGRGKSSRRAQF